MRPPFDSLTDIVNSRWGIEVEDVVEGDILDGRDFAQVQSIMQQSALETRKFGKSEQILRHDLCHYFLVLTERSSKDVVSYKKPFSHSLRSETDEGRRKSASRKASDCFRDV
jgi:hypothetical protein